MSQHESTATFERETELQATAPTLIEGLPGHGLVASIAVEEVTDQLGLDYHGRIRSGRFPPVASFKDGHTRDAVRVYARDDPAVMTLQSDVPIPPEAFTALGDAVIDGLAEEFSRALFIAGAPAQTESERGQVLGVATTEQVADDLAAAGVDLAEGHGLVGGVTGALVSKCHDSGVPAAVLIAKANPALPDPAAARAVIEDALEPLVDFDIDTEHLREQAEEIQRRKQQIVQQLRQQQKREREGGQRGPTGMYQ